MNLKAIDSKLDILEKMMNKIEIACLDLLRGETPPTNATNWNFWNCEHGIKCISGEPLIGKMVMKQSYYVKLVHDLSVNNDESISSAINTANYINTRDKGVLKPIDSVLYDLAKTVTAIDPTDPEVTLKFDLFKVTPADTVASLAKESTDFDNWFNERIRNPGKYMLLHDRAKKREREVVMKPGVRWSLDMMLQNFWTKEQLVECGYADWKPETKLVTKYITFSPDGVLLDEYDDIPKVPVEVQVIPVEVEVPNT